MDANKEPRILTTQEIEELAVKVANRVLITLGIDSEHPLEVQRDMQFARNLRTLAENAGRKTILTVVGAAVLGILALIVRSVWPS